MAEAKLTNLTSANTSGVNLQVNGNGTGKGGACRGDSGGPVFHGQFASNTIVAVTAFGLNQNCRGVDFSYRIDQQVLHDWIRDHVDEEAWSQISVVPL
jgi:secreted trypsin-like serine protease